MSPPPAAPSPSLAERARIGIAGTLAKAKLALTIGALGLSTTAATATWLSRSVRAETVRLDRQAAARGSITADTICLAKTFSEPSLAATLARLERTLPEDITLISVERNDVGQLRMTIDAGDPDQLHSALRLDSWLGRFRAQAQEQGETGRFRVVPDRSRMRLAGHHSPGRPAPLRGGAAVGNHRAGRAGASASGA